MIGPLTDLLINQLVFRIPCTSVLFSLSLSLSLSRETRVGYNGWLAAELKQLQRKPAKWWSHRKRPNEGQDTQDAKNERSSTRQDQTMCELLSKQQQQQQQQQRRRRRSSQPTNNYFTGKQRLKSQKEAEFQDTLTALGTLVAHVKTNHRVLSSALTHESGTDNHILMRLHNQPRNQCQTDGQTKRHYSGAHQSLGKRPFQDPRKRPSQ